MPGFHGSRPSFADPILQKIGELPVGPREQSHLIKRQLSWSLSISRPDMVTSRLLRPACRFLTSSRPCAAPSRYAFQPAASLPATKNRRRYATPSGVKEVAVRDALNEALAEELEQNDKVFVLGEEVAQYNGA